MNRREDPTFRTDIEGLRAIAVILVVLFHAGFGRLEGGFVGVDVFFVLSGFLITSLLLKEVSGTANVSLRQFWSRRARRLLPAACLTLVATMIASRFVMPPLQHRAVTIDGLYSTVFLANVRFTETIGDYFGNQLAETYPSPFLHYWSLAVEEQFYLFWPIVVLAATRLFARPKRALVLFSSVLVIASFVFGVWMAPRQPAVAFYLLPSRVCELLAGGLLAMVPPKTLGSLGAGLRSALGYVGFACIGTATLTFSESTLFPSYAVLLPVLGTVALLVSGSGLTAAWAPQRLLEPRALQWIGRRSYAIYLWHWPALVLLHVHHPTDSVVQRVFAVAASVILADLSMRFVEDPVRFNRYLASSSRRGLVLGFSLTIGSIALIGAIWASQPSLDGGEAAPNATLTLPANPRPSASPPVDDDPANPSSDSAGSYQIDRPPTTSATTKPATQDDPARPLIHILETQMAGLLEDAVKVTDVPSNLRPALTAAATDTAQVYRDGCISLNDNSSVLDCRYGAVGSAVKIVLFGDSHAAHWFPALETIATNRGAELIVMVKGGCPVPEVPTTRADLVVSCPAWRTEALAMIDDLGPDLVIASSLSGYTNDEELWQANLEVVLGQLREAANRVVLILDTPRAKGSPPVCLSDNLGTADACVADRSAAIQSARATAERAAAAASSVEVIDPTPWLCGPAACPVIIGDTLVYRDADHLTTIASLLLTPLLEAALF